MKIDFNREALLAGLNLLTSVIPARTPKPILRCVRITAGKKGTQICATDLEVGADVEVAQAKIGETGEVVIPADRLMAIVRESADDVLSLQAKDDSCHITGSDSHFTIFSQQPEQYPPMPAFDESADMEIPLKDLQAGIGQCLFATAKESSRYALNGVLMEIKGKKLSLVATDGRRLARSVVSLSAQPTGQMATAKIIMPAKAMILLEKIATSEKDVAAIKLLDNQVLIRCANVVISSSLVEGKFPKYEDIIPSDYDKKMKLSTDAVLSAVRRAALLTSEESRGIKLSAEKNMLVFTGRAAETGDAKVDMPIEYKGESIEMGFNPQFLIEALRVIKTDEFELELGQSDRPGLMKSGTNFLYVLMPINLS